MPLYKKISVSPCLCVDPVSSVPSVSSSAPSVSSSVPSVPLLRAPRPHFTALSVISNPRSMIANASRSSASVMQSGGFVKNVCHRTNV